MLMKWGFLFLIFLSLAWGQVVPQAGGIKLLAYDKKDQEVTHALYINNSVFFTVPTIDSASGIPPFRSSYIVRVDSPYNSVSQVIHINPDTIQHVYLERLFRLKHPVTDQPVIGFAGKGIRMDASTQDSASFLFVGWITPDFQEIHYYTDIYRHKVQYNSYGPYFNLPGIADVITISDSQFVLLTYQKQLWLLNYNINQITLTDSISSPLIGTQFYKTAVGNLHTYGIELSSGNIKATQIFLSPLALGATQYINNFAPSFLTSPTIYGMSISNKGDTLWAHGVFNNKYHYLYQFEANNGSLFLSDSMLVANNFSYFQNASTRLLSALSYPWLYIISSKWGAGGNWLNWDFSWMHYDSSIQNNYFTTHLFNTSDFQKSGSVSLGGDAFYDVVGIIAPSDSICIVYGWRFPLGDLTRTDGDAFIWKITWDGLVTPILGEAPKYAFKIFPNPAKNILKISGKTKEATTFLLRSLDGKEVLTQKFPAGQEDWELEVSQIPRGIYLLEILTEGGARFTEKVVLE